VRGASGVAAKTGGRHSLRRTHNARPAISSARFPKSHLELIAIDPDAPAPARRRWFGLDAAPRQAMGDEPGLVHWVVRRDASAGARPALASAGVRSGQHRRRRAHDAVRPAALGHHRFHRRRSGPPSARCRP
jgi:Glyoxalase-like domain